MKRYIQHEYLKISHFVTAEWKHPVHNHNHFEIVFIHRGKGSHCISGMRNDYAGKSLFLLAPCDFHSLHIEEETEVTFLKFNNVYFTDSANIKAHRMNNHIDEMLIGARKQVLPILKTETEVEKFESLVNLIVKEWNESKNETSELIFLLIQSILSIIKRNTNAIAKSSGKKHTEKASGILDHIHNNIFNTELSLENLASQFGFSKYYLGTFFKEQTGVNFRTYINQYKYHIIENRLKYSSLSIKEISDELNFTDQSHFNKFFKSQSGLSPSAYRISLRCKVA